MRCSFLRIEVIKSRTVFLRVMDLPQHGSFDVSWDSPNAASRSSSTAGVVERGQLLQMSPTEESTCPLPPVHHHNAWALSGYPALVSHF